MWHFYDLRTVCFRILSDFPDEYNENFINIIDLKNDLDEPFKKNKIVLLWAIGGAGKSTIAIQYCKYFCRNTEYTAVWFHANDNDKIDKRLREILIEDLKENAAEIGPASLEQCIRKISSHVENSKRPHLFVFDNIDENQKEVIQHFSRFNPNYLKILLTTRNRKISNIYGLNISQVALLSPSEVESKQFLVKSLTEKLGGSICNQLCENIFKDKIISTPYDLRSIVATLDSLIEGGEFEKDNLQKTIKKIRETRGRKTIFEHLQKYPECEKLMKYLLFLEPNEISLNLLKFIHEDDGEFIENLKKLEEYSVIENFYREGRKFFKVHDNTKESLELLFQPEKDLNNTKIELSTKLLNFLKGIDVVTKKNIETCKDAYSHIKLILQNTQGYDSLTLLNLLKAMSIIEEKYNMNFSNSTEIKRKILKHNKSIHLDQPNHPDIASSLNNLASAYFSQGNFTDAVNLFKEALELRRNIYRDQPNHLDIATSLNNLAIALERQGNLTESVKLHMVSLEMRRNIYLDQPNHPDIATSLNNLALALERQGNLTESVKLHMESLEMSRNIYRDQPNHPAIASSLNNLALALECQGNLTEAVKLYKQSLEMYRNIYRDQPTHPDIATSLNNLASALKSQGDLTEAVKLHKESLEMKRNIYRDLPNHPDIAASLNNLASALECQGNLTEAVKLYKQSLEMYRNIYRDQPMHPLIARILCNLANALKKQGNLIEAVKLHKEALEMKLNIHHDQPNHPAIATSLNNLAAAYFSQGNLTDAVKLFKDALEMYRNIYRDQPNNPDIARTLKNLSIALEEQGNLTENEKTILDSTQVPW